MQIWLRFMLRHRTIMESPQWTPKSCRSLKRLTYVGRIERQTSLLPIARGIVLVGHLSPMPPQPPRWKLVRERIFQKAIEQYPHQTGRNLHAAWMTLVNAYDAEDIQASPKTNPELAFIVEAKQSMSRYSDFDEWLSESRDLAISSVYTNEIIQNVLTAGESSVPLRADRTFGRLSKIGWLGRKNACSISSRSFS
ncbi:MAG: hypothetical protein U0905_13675 [Pirellulales bacterium]